MKNFELQFCIFFCCLEARRKGHDLVKGARCYIWITVCTLHRDKCGDKEQALQYHCNCTVHFIITVLCLIIGKYEGY